jgi:uncharacterized peroxidase-related enzyme
VTQDESLSESLKRDWRAAPLDERERAMLAFVEKLTLTPGAVTRDDHAPLRAAGFDDLGITQVTMIASMFAYFNRMADGLGVGRP